MRDSYKTTIGRWWWTLDRWSLLALFILVIIGLLLNFAGTPFIAKKLGHGPYYLLQKQIIFLVPSLFLIVFTSMLSPLELRNIAFPLMGVFGVCLVATLFFGIEIKGARRWLALGPLSIQSSEFIKPLFAVVCAWLFAHAKKSGDDLGRYMAGVLLLLVGALLILQPDFGMTFVVAAIWFVQFFLAGMPLIFVGAGIALGIAGILGAYMFLPHVASRIDRFFDPQAGDNYQVTKSLEAFASGGFFGKGPGEGQVKAHLPDAHADFIFAVAGEEFGLIICMIIIVLYAFIILRCLWRLYTQENLFILLAGVGLTVQFACQAFVNMASTLHLIPTKGMTLPFLSYGGSSLIALSFGMGMLFSLTRTTRKTTV